VAHGMTVAVEIPGFRMQAIAEGNDSFATLDIPGWSHLQEVGKPAVPVRTIVLAIPDGVEPVVTFVSKSEVRAAPLDVWPVQLPLPDIYPEPEFEFQRNADVYASDDFYPAGNIVKSSVGRLRNRRILVVEVASMRVRPASREALIAESFELEVTFTTTLTGNSSQSQGEHLREGFADGMLSKYMILMDDQYTNNAKLAEFVEWKKRKGYDVDIVKTSDIDAGGSPTNGQIISYMQGLSAADYPEYLLVIGDHSPGSGVHGFFFNSYQTWSEGYSDLYFACRDNTDFYPDLYHGRLPATNNASLTLMLDKILEMDRSPPQSNIYQRVCVAGQIQDYSGGANNIADRLFCETADSISCYFEQDAGGVDYTATRAMVNPDNVDTNCEWSYGSILWEDGDTIGTRVHQNFLSVTDARNRIIDDVNAGLAILQHRDHGSVGGWGDPYFSYSHVRSYLTNGVNRPVVFSINCLTGSYHKQNNFARAWLEHINGGAYAVFAPVDVSFSWRNDWLTHGFYAAFLSDYVSWHNASTTPNWPASKDLPAPGGAYGAAGSARRLGEILNFGKMYMGEHYNYDEKTFRLFHVFGDPETWLQLSTLTDLSISHPSTVGGGSQTITVTTGETNVQVCLYSEALNIHMVTNTTGTSASFDVTTSSTGTIHTTVTKYGCRPYEGSIFAGTYFEFNAAEHSADEDAGTVSITVERIGETNSAVSVDYFTSNDSAVAGSDYTSASGTLNFAAGQTNRTFLITLINDTDPEGQETMNLALRDPSTNTLLGEQDTAVLTIVDDDGPGELCFSSSLFWATEDEGQAELTVSRLNGDTGIISVDFATTTGSSAHAGVDFISTNGTLELTNGQLSASIYVDLINDTLDEANETFGVNLSNPVGAALASQTNTTLVLVDDDESGSLSFSSSMYTCSETSGIVSLMLTRTGGSDGGISVDYSTSNMNAVAGQDYTTSSGSLQMTHGITSATVNITILNDSTDEQAEYFAVGLCNPTNVQIYGISTTTVRIVNEDGHIFDEFLDDDPGWITEGDWAFGKPQGRGGSSTGGSGDNDPLSGYTGTNVYGYNLSGSYANDITQTLYLTSCAIDCSGYEDVTLHFWRWLGVAVPILDRASIQLSIDGNSWVDVWSNISWISESAWTNMHHSLSPLADNQSTVYVRWGMGTTDASAQYCGWNIDDVEITGTAILSNVARCAFSAVGYSFEEEGGTVDVAVVRSIMTTNAISLDYTTSNGTAHAGTDFNGVTGTLYFAAGITTQFISLALVNDSISEAAESFTVSLSNPSAEARLASPSTATITITDSDAPGFAFGSPVVTTDPTGQNNTGDNFDLDTSGGKFIAEDFGGFGQFGSIYFNYDNNNLYIGATGCTVETDNNAMILFLNVDTLTDNASNLWNKSGAPVGLDYLHNVSLTQPMDIAILLGDEYGDGNWPDFELGSGSAFGQGVFYLGDSSFVAVPGVNLSQFDGTGSTATTSADDDSNRLTDRWEVSIPWSNLNATSFASISNCHLAGLIVSDGVMENDRYISGNYLGSSASGTRDEHGNFAYNFVTLDALEVNTVTASNTPAATLVAGAPTISSDPAGQNNIGDNFDFNSSGGAVTSAVTVGFGDYGSVYLNYDASSLYIGGVGADPEGNNNAMIVFLDFDSLDDDVTNLWNKSGQPNALDKLHNVGFDSGMDIAIVLGDEYGDGTWASFTLGGGADLGQGVFFLGGSGGFATVSGAHLSQFDGTGTNATISTDDDSNRLTDRWEASIPWSNLNATSVSSLSNCHIAGLFVSDGVSGDDRYISGNYLGSGATGTLDGNTNFGYSFVSLSAAAIRLPPPNTLPVATILAPRSLCEYIRFESISCRGTANDTEDGAMTNLSWSSSINGSLGTGTNLFVTNLTHGTHTITLTATDSCFAEGSDTITFDVLEDIAANGLPDEWETNYWPGATSGGGTNDYDNDGLSNHDEWLVGSDPTSADSVFCIDTDELVSRPEGNVIGWQARANRTYTLEWKTNVMDSTYQQLFTGLVPSSDGTLCVTDAVYNSESTIIYRLQIER